MTILTETKELYKTGLERKMERENQSITNRIKHAARQGKGTLSVTSMSEQREVWLNSKGFSVSKSQVIAGKLTWCISGWAK